MRARLILIPSALLALGIAAAIFVTLYDARGRIESETNSGVELGGLLIDYALDDVAVSANPDDALERLLLALRHVRHITVEYRPEPGGGAPAVMAAAPNPEAPKWFLDFFAAPKIVKTYPVRLEGERRGELVISTKPSDEVAEIFDALAFLTTLLAAISAGVVGLILLTARQTLRPLNDLVAGLDRLRRGEFAGLEEIRIVELRQIGEQFNRLARSLARTEADNHLLIDRLMSIQETERKELARELHDEFGASLFGIRAAASCIIDDASSGAIESRKDEIIGRAEAISALADSIQKQNYRILERVRPVILNQIGLVKAVGHLVEEWGAANREIDCALSLPQGQPGFGEEVSLTSYRTIQECLTNVARHAKAKRVRVALSAEAGDGERRAIRIEVEDDGVGLPAEFRFGFGFLGMSERVRKLGGALHVANGALGGARVEALLPAAEPEARDACKSVTSTSLASTSIERAAAKWAGAK